MGRVLLLSTGSCRAAVSEDLAPSCSCDHPGFTQQVEHAAQFHSGLAAEAAAVAYFDPYLKKQSLGSA